MTRHQLPQGGVRPPHLAEGVCLPHPAEGMCPPQALRGQGGFLTVEAVVMIMALVVLLPLAYAGWNMGFAALKARAVAQQLQQVSEAAKVYARSQDLLTTLTPGANAVEITGAQLINAGVLPHSGADIENAWKQKYKVFYSIPATVAGVPDRLTVVVTTISDPASPVAEADARKAAGFGGAGVGLVADAGGGTLALLNVVGGWRIAVNTPPLPSTEPAIGSIGSYASLDDKALNTDVLYRVDVPGRPELNQMHVNLDMRDHAIVDVKNVQFNATSVKQADLTTVCDPAADTEGKVFYHTSTTADLTGLYACKGGKPVLLADGANSAPVRNTMVVDPGTLITKPTCTGGGTPFISVSPASVTVGGLPPVVGTSIYSSYADAGTSQWRVSLTVLGATLPVSGKLSVITSCTKP